MTIPPEVRVKFYTLRVLALVLMAFAGAIFLRSHGFGLFLLGITAIFVGLWIIRRSNVAVWRARGHVVAEWSLAQAVKRVGPWAWAFTVASLLACFLTCLLMYVDALHGGKEVWPVYALLGAVLALVVTSSYVVMKVFR